VLFVEFDVKPVPPSEQFALVIDGLLKGDQRSRFRRSTSRVRRPGEGRLVAVNILTVNLLFSTLVFWVGARIYILPRLRDRRSESVLLPILLLHSFRHLGLMFLAPGPSTSSSAGVRPPAAFGDLIAAMLALVSLVAVRRRHKASRLLYGSSTSRGRSTLARRRPATVNRAAPYMGPPTGFRPSGYPCCW